MSTRSSDEEARVWRGWCEATGMSLDVGPQWVARFLSPMIGVLAWPVRLHPSMYWLRPPLYARQSLPESFADLTAALSEAPVPTGGSVGDLVEPSFRIRIRQGTPPRIAYGPVVPVGTPVRLDAFVPDHCDGFDLLEATVLGTPSGDLPVRLPVGRAGAAYLLARLAIVEDSDPLASDHSGAAALHERLLALLDQSEDDFRRT